MDDANSDRRSAISMIALRWLVVFCQAATILVTWPLWQTREMPPLLPAVSVPQFDYGFILLGSLVLILVRPRLGLICHSLLVGLAMSSDQTRMQPQIFSHLFLLWGTLSSEAGKTISRAHLIAVWFYGGFHKLLSPAYFTVMSQALWRGLFPNAPIEYASWIGGSIALMEMVLAILVIVPETRRFAAKLAVGMHLGILWTLSPWGINFNEAVWPWNVSLSCAGYVMFSTWEGSLFGCLQRISVSARVATVALLVSPVLYYFGMLDACLSNCLYAVNYPTARVSSNDSYPIEMSQAVYCELNVYLPPEHRLFVQLFSRIAKPGDRLQISDPRRWYESRGEGTLEITYDDISTGLQFDRNRIPKRVQQDYRLLAD